MTMSVSQPLRMPFTQAPPATGHWQVGLFVGWMCLAPSMPGTPLRDAYAYVLAGSVILYLISSPQWTEQLLRAWLQPSALGMLVGVLGTWVSTVMTPLPVTASDQFQLGRELYPLMLIAGLPVLWRGLSLRQINESCERFGWLFLAGCLAGFLLQSVSSAFFDIMLQYYYTEFNDQARGFMEARPGLTFGNPNVLGIAIAFVGISMAANRTIPAWKAVAVLGLSGVLIAWTASRTGMFAFAVGILPLGLLRIGRLLPGLVMAALGLFVLSFIVDMSAYSDYFSNLMYRFFQDRSSMKEREDLWAMLLSGGEWPNNSLFGLGPAKQSEAIFDSGYVLALYRYGYFGLFCTTWWQACLLLSGVYEIMKGDPAGQGLRRTCLAACFACASYAMAPLTDPRLCALYLLLLSTTTIAVPAAMATRPAAPYQPARHARSPEIRPCAS